MAVDSTEFIPAQFAPNSTTLLYTAPTAAMVTAVNVSNISAGYEEITIHLVQSGGSPSNSNAVLSDHTLAPGESYQCPEVQGQVLAQGSSIHVLASAASAINIRVSGALFT